MPYCSSCGTELSGDEQYCSSCGESLKEGDDEAHVVNVNVNQSADHASSTAAAGGEGDATATAKKEDTTKRSSTSTQESDGLTAVNVLARIALGVGVIGSILSYMVGASNGMNWWDMVTTMPYAFPFWVIGAMVALLVIAAIRETM